MKSTTNKRLVEIFTQAKEHLRVGSSLDGNRYICFAIEDVGGEGWVWARQIVTSRLGRFGSVEHYLIGTETIQKGNSMDIYSDVYDKPQWRAQVQDFRHRWLDELIKEFS